MPRYSRVIEPDPLHHRETFIKETVNKSLTTEHCQFFLKKYGSDKVFTNYLNKYYPQNGGCSYHAEVKNKTVYFPELVGNHFRGKQNSSILQNKKEKTHRLNSLYAFKQKPRIRYNKSDSVDIYGMKLKDIIKKTKTQYFEG